MLPTRGEPARKGGLPWAGNGAGRDMIGAAGGRRTAAKEIAMSARLDHANSERSISEMWGALAEAPQDEHYDAAYAQCAAAETQLRAALAAQDRLDAAAPELLAVCRKLLDDFDYAEPRTSMESLLRQHIPKLRTIIMQADGKERPCASSIDPKS